MAENNLKKLKNRRGNYFQYSDSRLQEFNGDEWVNIDAIEITSKQFIKEYKNNNLIAHQQFLITDYQLLHYLNDSNEIRRSKKEKILVKTVGAGSIEPKGRSFDFPEDIIYFDPKGDKANTNQIPVNDSRFKGFIYRRYNEVRDLDVSFDYRNVKFRRWKMKDSDANSLGLPTGYHLPRKQYVTGWEYGTLNEGYDGTVDYGCHVFDASDSNDYIDVYPFYNYREFDANLKLRNVFINNTPEIYREKGNLVSRGTDFSLPNLVVMSDTNNNYNEDISNVKINANSGDNHILGTGLRKLTVNTFIGNMIFGKAGSDLGVGEWDQIRFNLFTFSSSRWAGDPSANVQYNSVLSFPTYTDGSVQFIGYNIHNHFQLADDNGNIMTDEDVDRGYFKKNTLINVDGLHFSSKNNNFKFNYLRSLTPGELTGINSYNVKFDKPNETIEGFTNDRVLLKSSNFKTKKDINTSNNTLEIDRDTINSWTTKYAGEYVLFGVYEIDDTDSSGDTSLTLEKIDNPPTDFSFTIRPVSGIDVTLTHNTDSNGIRLEASDQPSILLSGDNGDSAELELVNGTIFTRNIFKY